MVLTAVGILLHRLTRPTPSATPDGSEQAPATARPVSEDDVLTLMSVAGEAMIDAGFDVDRVQTDLHDIASAHGLPEVEVLAMPTVLLVSTPTGRGVRTAAVAAGQVQLRLHQIEALDDAITQARRGLDPLEASRRIRAIKLEPAPYSRPVQLLGSVLATMGLAALLGSTWRGVLIAGALGVVTGVLVLTAQLIPSRYQALVTVVASAAVSLTVFLLARAGLTTDVVPCLIAPLVTLLPGALLTTAVIELATGQMIAGAGRLAAGGTQLLLLGLGIVGPALLVGIPALELTTAAPALGAIGPWLGVAVFGVGITVNRCSRPRSLGWILIVLYVAYGAQVLGGLVVGGVLSAFVGAVVMTPVADLVARQRTGPPAIVSFSPAFWLLVPGALGLMGVATMLSGDAAGQDTVLTTVVTMVSIALGVLVGRALSTLLQLRRDQVRPA
ncbi:MAG TPA: threonine/serine exporter family protein [Microlunatus sp.]|nr:threonine/serine exporter family protein [Microlunatus sp.]